MRFFATILLFGLLVAAALSQSKKPTSPATKTPSAAAKPKPASARSKPTATPAKKPSEKAEWDKAVAISNIGKQIVALRKFVEAFPKSTRKAEAFGLITAAEAELGNEKLAAGDGDAAIVFLKAAATDAPKPIPDQLFTDTLSKIPANLYFRGLRDAALEISKILEAKAEANLGQLLSIAGFYLSVENGSEARRVAENAIKIDPNSAAAYQTLGLANRVDFKLEESAAAYAKALELEPESLQARRGLAEMKRSLGKPDEAITLYREILVKDEANVPARTGLILALFDADKRADAEAEMARSLEANPGNVILLAGAAYWYAVHDEGAQAIALAQKAIEADPRFIWSHIALARGFMSQKKPVDAERTLLAARRYGNFPTLEYEIASARLSAGLYREAAEELSKSFSVKDGVIRANLGGRVPGESKSFTELVGPERRASIFAPTAADNPDNAAQLRALLEFKQELDSQEPNPEKASNAADEFIRGDDKMKVYRQIFAASELLEKKVALKMVLEITQAAPSSLEAGLDVAEPATAVMASELYERRAVAAASGQYVNVPEVRRPTLSAVLRGRIEEISGWALYQMDDAALAVVHLKRAVGVLPADSAWWRSSTWRLGTALVVSGNDAEALEAYIKSYKSSGPDAVRYNAIEAVYRRVKGNTLGLEEKIGPNPSQPRAETVAQKIDPTPENKTDTPPVVPIKTEPTPTAEIMPTASPDVAVRVESTPTAEIKTEPTPGEVVNVEPTPVEAPADVPVATPTAETGVSTAEATPLSTPEEVKLTPTPETLPKPTSESSPEEQKTLEEKPKEVPGDEKPTPVPKELFPPVIITIPAIEPSKTAAKPEPTAEATPTAVNNNPANETKPRQSPTAESKVEEPKPTDVSVAEKRADESTTPSAIPSASGEPTPQPTPEIKPCTFIIDVENITLKNNQGVLALIVRREGDEELDGLNAVSSSPQDVSIRREAIEGLNTQALFVVRSISTKTGVYQVTVEMPCGKKEIVVKVQ